MAADLSSTRDTQTATVYLGPSFASLTARTDVFAQSVRRAMSPGSDEAQLVSDYGEMALPGDRWQVHAPLALQDQCCEVRVTVAGVEHTIFQGMTVADVVQPDGVCQSLAGSIPTGRVLHRCRGLDWFLERIHPHQSVTEVYGSIAELFPFNGRGTPPERNCSLYASSDVSGTSHLFAWDSLATLWSARDILEYVLRFASAQTDYTWVLAGETGVLDDVTPQVEQRGRNLRQIVHDCIRPQDGVGALYSVSGSTITVTIATLTDIAIADVDGIEALPANDDVFNLDATMDTDRDVSAPVLTPVAESAYARVEVISEPIMVVGMLGRASDPVSGTDGLVRDWTSADIASFNAADDEGRQAEALGHVFARWRLPGNWSGVDWAGNNLLPTWDPDTAAYSFATAGPCAVPALVFERTLPYLADDDRRVPALLLLNSGAAWVQPERSADSDLPAVGLDVGDTGPVLNLRTKSNVSLGGAAFTGSSSFAKAWDPVTDGMLVTVAFYTQVPLSVRMHASGSSGTKRVYVEGYHLWLCPAAATWSPGSAIAAGTILRDDRAALKRLCAQLSVWYGRTRNTLSYSAAVAPGAVRVGRMVGTVYSGGATTPVGTPVTSETWTWDDRGSFAYSLSTDFADLDLTQINRKRVETGEKELSRRIRRVEERLTQTPLRVPIGAGTGGGGVLLRITGLHTDSPASGVRMYVGDIYGNGSTAVATQAGVTVRIPGLAADVTLPSSGSWSSVPVCLGVRTTATWTGAAETHTSDTVYEALGLLLVV